MNVREPDRTHVTLDPETCSVMEGHQHDPSGIEELAESIATLGQLHPSLVIEYSDGRRLIAAGRRRWMACKMRGIPLIANIWTCDAEDINLELFAKAIRVAENIERRDPSAIDIALQLQAIRNERQLRNAAELGSYMGMSESRVKKYLSVFAGSDHLRKTASTHAFPLKPLLELTKCEKRLGANATKRLIERYIKGDVSTSDLAKLRGKAPRQKRAALTPAAADAQLRKSGDALLRAIGKSSPESLPFVAELITKLKNLLSEEKAATAEK